MPAALYNLVIDRGEDFNFTLRILDSLDDPVSALIGSCKAEIREANRKPLIASFTITNLGDGTLQFSLDSEVTKTLPTSLNLKWDFFFSYTNGNLSRLLSGSVTVSPNITNV